jgi:hypothetical protein
MAVRTVCEVDWGKKSIEQTNPRPTPIAPGLIRITGRVPSNDGCNGPMVRKISEMIVPKT